MAQCGFAARFKTEGGLAKNIGRDGLNHVIGRLKRRIGSGFVKLRFTGRRIMHLSLSDLSIFPCANKLADVRSIRADQWYIRC